jgi:hypothetical protein
MHTPSVTESSEFMQLLGMRLVAGGDEFAVLEMRGGTHLVLTSDPDSALIKGDFDLMVEDLDATHRHYTELGLDPGDILLEPGGTVITFNSSHVGELAV